MPITAIKYFASSITALLVFILIGGLLHFFVIEITEINGISMEPTLIDGDIVIIDKVTALISPLQRGQIVSVFDEYDNFLLVKRIVGLPGEQILLKDGLLYILSESGEEKILSEPYLGEGILTKPKKGNEEVYAIIPPFEYFILGDNRFRSTDSRIYGSIHRREIIGIVRPIKFLSKKK